MGLNLALLAAAARGHRKRRGNARPQRRLRPIVPNARAEIEYKRALLQLVKRLRALVAKELQGLKAYWPQPTTDSRTVYDAAPVAEVDLAIARIKGQLGGLDTWAKRMVGLAVERNRESVDKRLASEINRAIGTDVTGLLNTNGPLLQSMRKATTDNVELIKSIPEQYLDRVYETVTDSWTQGLRWESMVDQISEDGDITEERAKLIARDQTSKMNAAFNQERQQQVGIERYEWSTSQDERVRDSHAAMEGQLCDWDDPPDVDGERVHPGEAINCFPAESQIQFAHAVEKAYRRWYSGELAEVVTSSGKTLRGTPNHPVLTSRGWVALGALNQGDDVVEVSDQVLDGAKEDHQHRVPSIGEVFHSAASLGTLVPARGAVHDFHGDGSHGDVDVVLAARPLFVDLVTPGVQGGRNLALPVATDARPRAGALHQLLIRARRASDRIVGCLREFAALLWPKPLHAFAVCGGSATDFNAGLQQPRANRAPIVSESLGDGQLAFSSDVGGDDLGLVERKAIVGNATSSSVSFESALTQSPRKAVLADADDLGRCPERLPFAHQLGRVVQTRRFDWHGHVFNLQTGVGWYVTEGIITHNCRCVAIPVVDMEEAGEAAGAASAEEEFEEAA